MINKFYDLATMQPALPAAIQSHYEALDHHASECIGCRACEPRCPLWGEDRRADEQGERGIWKIKKGIPRALGNAIFI